MSHLYELHRFVLYELPWLDSKKFLDLGCGKGIWGYLLRAEMKGDNAFMVGIDVYLKNLVFTRSFRIYDDVVLADTTFLPFRRSSFDISLASEIIEHVDKKLHDQFFIDVERVTSEMVVLTTPNGPWELNSKSHYDNIHEYHLSAQSVSELRSNGYSVRGIGFKFLNDRGPLVCLLMQNDGGQTKCDQQPCDFFFQRFVVAMDDENFGGVWRALSSSRIIAILGLNREPLKTLNNRP